MFIKEKGWIYKGKSIHRLLITARIFDQRGCMLPKLSLEAMTKSCTVDAKKGRIVVGTDIQGAFLHADMNDTVT